MHRTLTGSFESRHIGPRAHETDAMLRTIGVSIPAGWIELHRTGVLVCVQCTATARVRASTAPLAAT